MSERTAPKGYKLYKYKSISQFKKKTLIWRIAYTIVSLGQHTPVEIIMRNKLYHVKALLKRFHGQKVRIMLHVYTLKVVAEKFKIN